MNYLNDNLPFNAVACNLLRVKNGKFSQNGLTVKTKLNYIEYALAKSKAGRDKLKISMANNSAPKCAFFVRSVRTPSQNSLFSDSLSPMVARNGQPFAVGCFPLIAVCHPVTRYRQNVTIFAVTLENLSMETAAMYQFIFARLRTPRHALKIRILADNEQQARARFTHGENLLFVGKINLHRQNAPQNHRSLAMKGGIYA